MTNSGSTIWPTVGASVGPAGLAGELIDAGILPMVDGSPVTMFGSTWRFMANAEPLSR